VNKESNQDRLPNKKNENIQLQPLLRQSRIMKIINTAKSVIHCILHVDHYLNFVFIYLFIYLFIYFN
jgi:hypothetical protein